MARLLLVEDDPDQLVLRRLILEHAGHHVQTASSFSGAEQLLGKHHPEVLIMDLRLPRIEDGLALLRCLAESQPHIRVIVLSGWSSDLEQAPEARRADRVFIKPVRPDRLLQAISELAGKHKNSTSGTTL